MAAPASAGLGEVRRVRRVGAGVDTLHLFTVWAVSPAWVEKLATLKRAAHDAGGAQRVEVGGVTLDCQPHGAGGAPYLLDGALFAVKVNPAAAQKSPRVSVECRALALWSMGWRQAAARAVGLVREICGEVSVEVLNVQVSRVDVCVDFQGWVPTVEDRELLTCRVRRRSRGVHRYEPTTLTDDGAAKETSRVLAVAKRLERAETTAERVQLLEELQREELQLQISEWGDARAFSGFSLGRGKLCARLYDKTAELSVSRKQWFREVWRKEGKRSWPGFDELAPVWRLEFQLRREALLQFRDVVDTLEAGVVDAPALGSWAECEKLLPALWAYLTRGWLRHGRRTAEDRQAVSPQWAALQDAWSAEAVTVELHRPALDCARKTVVPALAGYMATAVAQVQEVHASEGGAPLPYWRVLIGAVRAAHAYAETRDQTVEERAAARAERLAERRRVLGHREIRPSGDLVLAGAVARGGRRGVGPRFEAAMGAERGVDENGNGWVTYFPAVREMRRREVGQ